MAWNYFEKREQPTPAKQLRHRCDDCHREWIGGMHWNGPLDVRFPLPPEGACPVCWHADVEGSGLNVRDIEVKGWFDSTTDPVVDANILASMTPQQIEAELLARQARPTIHEGSRPPLPLMPEIYAEPIVELAK